ncbi:hypothetical protein [Streptomyces sp. AMCC400023]|uniref:hypothetical protein n=1 Tax=Streptomyces sp. AMCC400023 TaxID=2056258 RepID=UPI001F23D1D1|nr:hypothetical protein [Streptomyces sp. AMCC400023]UJV42077.1 hypothetical protein CVT30_21485 [Streptomyces sp. AMCC400023]
MTASQFGAAFSVLAALVAVAGAITAFRARRAAERAAARTVEDGTVCGAYKPPATSADSGLCARCGMFDYRHSEAS